MSEPVTADRIVEFSASLRRTGVVDRTPATCDEYVVDDARPHAVATPRNLSELQTVLSEAHRYGAALIPFGSGSQRTFGNRPHRYGVALSMRGLDGIIAHVPDDMTVTVEAGVTLTQLESVLAQHGQFLPVRPASGMDGTVGGILAANDQGMRRYAFGTARDWTIGIAVVQADGTLVRSGGRVVKNVAGYDLGKLFIGSLGTLGVIAEATFKVAPLPAAGTSVAAAFASPHAAAMFLLAVRDEALAVHAAELLSPAAADAVVGVRRWAGLLHVAGGGRAVERSLREVRDLADGLGGDAITDISIDPVTAWERAFAPAGLALRCSVLPSQVADAADALAPADDDTTLLSATLGAGVIRLRYGVDDERAVARIESTRRIVEPLGGTAIVESAAPAVKAQIDVFGARRGDFGIMRRIKEAFDHDGILAPGRFAGGL